VCAEGLFVFGVCALAFIYVLAPILDNMIRKINRRVLLPLAVTLLLLISADFIYSSFFVPNTGYGITGNFDKDEDTVAVETVIEEST
jgi:predicted PurR-regulated permease PerM